MLRSVDRTPVWTFAPATHMIAELVFIPFSTGWHIDLADKWIRESPLVRIAPSSGAVCPCPA